MSQGFTPALLMHFEGMQTYFCPSGLCFAPGSRSCQLAGRRKTQRLNICKEGENQFRMTSEPQVLLGAAKKIERAECSVPPAQPREKPCGRIFPSDGDFYSQRVGKLSLSFPLLQPPPCLLPRGQTLASLTPADLSCIPDITRSFSLRLLSSCLPLCD